MTGSENDKRSPLADWRKIQETLADAARLSSREIQRGVAYARRNLEKVHLVQRRKDLFSQLGRNLYEAHLDGLPPEVEGFLAETEFSEIIAELKDVDAEIARRTGSAGASATGAGTGGGDAPA